MHLDDTSVPVAPAVLLIPLVTGKGEIKGYTQVDLADAPLLSPYRWYLDRGGYARCNVYANRHTTALLIHRLLMGLVKGDGLEVDHINHDRLDNRRQNLRVVPKFGNRQNQGIWRKETSSRFRGISWEKRTKRWLAIVWTNGKRYQIGRFKDELVAAEAVRQARLRLMPYALD